VREGLRRVLERAPDVDVLAVAASQGALEEALGRLAPDVVVVAARLPPEGRDEGVRLAVRLRAERPLTGVVVVDEIVSAEHVLSLAASGVARRAYLVTDRIARGEDVLAAVRSVAAGGAVVDPAVLERLAEPSANVDKTRLARLTQRELRVLGLIAEGHSNAAIAERLGVTKRAIEKHVSETFQKLGLPGEGDVSRRVAAALVYLQATGRLSDLALEG
jgi:DNA-binding NarL/FixJ family response regulator